MPSQGFCPLLPTSHSYDWSLSACVWFGGSATLAKRQGLSVPRTMAILILIIPLFVLGARAHALLFEAQLPLVRLVEEPSLLFRPGWRLPGPGPVRARGRMGAGEARTRPGAVPAPPPPLPPRAEPAPENQKRTAPPSPPAQLVTRRLIALRREPTFSLS